mgnify:FL=1
MESIVKRFFNDSRVKTSINLAHIKRTKSNMVNNDKRKFAASIELGRLAKDASEYYDSPECKEIRTSMGLEMKKEEFFLVSFGFKKSWLYKAIKAYNLGEDAIEQYTNAAADFEQNNGVRKSLSIAELLKFNKNIEAGMSVEDAINPPKGAGNEESQSNGEESENNSNEDSTCTHTFVDKVNGVNFRIDNGVIVTTCDKDSILASLTELMALVSEM